MVSDDESAQFDTPCKQQDVVHLNSQSSYYIVLLPKNNTGAGVIGRRVGRDKCVVNRTFGLSVLVISLFVCAGVLDALL